MAGRNNSLLPALLIGPGLLLAACGTDNAAPAATTSTTAAAPSTAAPTTVTTAAEAAPEAAAGSDTEVEEFPDVLDATATQADDGTWTVSATLSSPYDVRDRYADAWRVLGPDGTEYGIRVLAHDHATEQPFTRSQAGIVIPDDVKVVTIQGRDLVSGWGGATFELTLES